MGSAGSADDGECTCLILASPGCAWLCAVWPHGHFVPLWHSQLGPQWCLLHSAAGSDFTIFTSIAQPFEILLRSFEPRIQARNPCQCKDHGGHCLHVLPAWMAPDLQCSSDDQWRETHFFNPFFLKLSEISRYLVIQLPALYVDNQNPKIGLKAHLSAWRQDAFRTHWKRFHLGSGLCSLSDFEVFVPCTSNFALAEPQSVQLSHFCRSLKRTIPRNLSRPKSASGNTSLVNHV